ncbi:MAG: hypothetical protein ABR920_18230 [Terriglobales bacterium]
MKPLDVRVQERVVEQWKVDPTAAMFNAQKIRKEEKAKTGPQFRSSTVVEALRLGAKSRHGREAGGVYWRKQTVPLTLANDSGRLTGKPEVDRSKADFPVLIPPWKPDSFRIADKPRRNVAGVDATVCAIQSER